MFRTLIENIRLEARSKAQQYAGLRASAAAKGTPANYHPGDVASLRHHAADHFDDFDHKVHLLPGRPGGQAIARADRLRKREIRRSQGKRVIDF